MIRSLLFIIILLFAGGCNFKPKYCRPYTAPPEHWRFTADSGTTGLNMRFWKQLGDPVLDELICKALRHNYDIKVAIANVQSYWARLGVARSYLYPTIYGTGVAARDEVSTALIPLIPGQQRISNYYDLFLNLTWELDFWSRIQNLSEVALHNYLGSIDARRVIVLTVVSSVAESYILLRQYDEQLHVSRDTLKSREESLRLAKIRYEGGQTSQMQVDQAASEVEEAKVAIIDYELQIALQEDMISVLIGENPEPIIRGKNIAQLCLPPYIPAGLPSDLLFQRPDIMQAEQAILAANAQIGVARANFFPQIDLTGMYGTASTQLNTLFTNPAESWFYGLSFNQPIFNGGRLDSELDLAIAQKCGATYQYIQTVKTAFQEVSDALIGHQLALELVEVQRQRVVVLTDYLKLARIQYDNGETDYLSVLDAERHLFNAQLDFVQAEGDSYVTFVSLYKALGGGWVIDADSVSLSAWCH